MSLQGGGLILAAGRGRRYGSDKRRVRGEDGRTLLAATLSIWQQVLPDLRVVLRGQDEPGEREFAAELTTTVPGLAITFATHCDRGMGASLAAGIRDCRDWDFVLVGLGDMPYLRPDTLSRLLAALQQAAAEDAHCIVRPSYQQRPGHPVGFGRGHFPALARLEGDVGARAIMQSAAAVIDLPCDDPGIHQDVDTPDGHR